MVDLKANLEAVRARIAAAARAAGRKPEEVRLLPVTKFHPAAVLAELRDMGVRAVGENREQEARLKAAEVPGIDIHMIGQIQTKKTNAIARWAAAVHSVDSVRLAARLGHGVRLACDRGDRAPGALPCLVQVSFDGDVSRGGVPMDEVPRVAEAVDSESGLEFRGLMCVPPLGADPAEVFDAVRELRDALGPGLEFSAGMSADLEQAIACGSTIVRVGTDIVGPRPVA